MGLEIESAIMGAVFGSLIGYYLGQRITRRQRLHESYKRIFSSTELAIVILDGTSNLQKVDVENIKNKTDMISSVGRIGSVLGLVSDLGVHFGLLKEFEDITGTDVNKDKPRVSRLRMIVIAVLNWELARVLIQIYQEKGTLDFIRPGKDVRDSIQQLVDLIGGESVSISRWAFKEAGELAKSETAPPVDTEVLRQSLTRVKDLMKNELQSKW